MQTTLTYLIIPAVNVNTRSNELQHVSDWAASNNLSLNLSMSEEIVFVDKRKKHKFNIPDTLDGLKRVQNIKILGVTFTNGLSVTPHVQHLATSNAQILYALKILRAHGPSIFLVDLEVFYLGHLKNFYTIQYNGNTGGFPFRNFSQAFIPLTSMVGLCWSPRQTKSL